MDTEETPRKTASVARDLLDVSTHMRANQFLPPPLRIAYDVDEQAIEVTVAAEDASWWLTTLDVNEGEPDLMDLPDGAVAVTHHCRLPLRRPSGVCIDVTHFRTARPAT